MRLNLRDKGVLVTGASRGIGAALARVLARRGARLALVGRSEAELSSVRTELLVDAAQVEVICADLCVEEERVRVVSAAREKLGAIDVVVNNAGKGLYGRVEDLSSEQLRSVYELNLVAPAHLCSLLLPAMREQGAGAIVMVSSVIGARAIPMSGGYCASKFALEGLSQSLRAELMGSGITLLVVRPGRTESSFREDAMSAGFRPNDKLRPMSAEVVAEASVRALERGKSRVNFTAAGKAMMLGERVSPRLVDRAMSKLYRKMLDVDDSGQ
jgi:short-subunit dehydrogenase